jgi:hypothetical protein
MGAHAALMSLPLRRRFAFAGKPAAAPGHREIIEQTLQKINAAGDETKVVQPARDRDSWCDQFSDELLKLRQHTGHQLARTLALYRYDPAQHLRDMARQYDKAQRSDAVPRVRKRQAAQVAPLATCRAPSLASRQRGKQWATWFGC